MPAIEFSRIHSYLPVDDGISLPVILDTGAEKVRLFAQVDTGRLTACLNEGSANC